VIEAIRIWREQRRIQALIDRISRSHDAQMKEARASNMPEEDRERIAQENYVAHEEADDELLKLHSSYYIRAANKLMVPTPPFMQEGGGWMESPFDGSWHLTRGAIHELRNAVRAERKARQEWLTIWLSLVVGAIGALAALVAVWKD
jgi:hypothetical protein